MTPAWLTDIFAALMVVVAVVMATRLVAARPWRRGAVVVDTDIAQLLMAIAMAGMLASSLATFSNTVWAVVFGVLTAWFVYRVVRDARVNGVRALAVDQSAPHLVHAAAMLYLFFPGTTTAMAGMTGMAGMGGSAGATMQTLRYPTLAFALALILIGYTIWDLDQLHGFRHRLAGAVARPPQPALAGATAEMGHVGTATAAFSGPSARGGTAANSSASSAGTERARSNGTGESGRSGLVSVVLSPGVTVDSRIALGVTMALMLALMI